MEENLGNELKEGISELLRRANSEDKNVSAFRDELAALILSDIRNIMGEKHSSIYDQLKSFENAINSVFRNTDNQKLIVETSRIASDLNTVYTKLSAQEMLLQNMYKLVDTIKSDRSPELISKLNGEFMNFSRGFEHITATLNKNFTEFLSQVQSYSPKEDFKKLEFDLDKINTNTSAIISALAIIDHKYQDLKSLITIITEKENTFVEGLQQLNQIGLRFDTFAQGLKNLSDKEDISVINEKISGINTFLDNLRTSAEGLDIEQKSRLSEFAILIEKKIDKILEKEDSQSVVNDLGTLFSRFSEFSDAIRTEVSIKLENFVSNLNEYNSNLTTSFSREFDLMKTNFENVISNLNEHSSGITTSFSREFDLFKTNLSHLNDEIASFKEIVTPLRNSVQTLDEELEVKLNGNAQILSDAIKSVHSDIQNTFSQLESYKDSINETSKEGVASIRDLVNQALLNIENLRVGTQLKQLAVTVEQNATQIKESFDVMTANFAQVSENSNIEVLKQLNISIPGIADKLEIFRSLIASENSDNIQILKDKMAEFIDVSKAVAHESLVELREDCNTRNREFANGVKNEITQALEKQREEIDKITNESFEKHEKLNTDVRYELVEHKTAMSTLINTVSTSLDNYTKKAEELGEVLSGKSKELEDALGERNKDLTVNIGTSFEHVQTNIKNICEKISSELSTKIANSNGLTAQNLAELKTVVESFDENSDLKFVKLTDKVVSILESGENIAQQLEQIKNELFAKVDSSFDYSQIEALAFSLERVKNQIQDLSDAQAGSGELAKIANKSLLTRVDELGEEITKLSDKIEAATAKKEEPTEQKQAQVDPSSLKEFISGFEFLQSNFIDELANEFKIQKEVLKELLSQQAQELDYVNVKRAVQDALEDKLPDKVEKTNEYSFSDVEADFAKLRLSIEEEQKLYLPERLDEIRNIGLENMRLSKKADKQINNLGDWLDNTASVIDILSEKVEKAEKLNIQEIKTRLIKSETESGSSALNETMNEFIVSVSKKYQIQEMKIENIDEKITTLIQRQSDVVDMKAFIDAFHESAIQTKSLLARVEGIENQINGIHGSLERIITYIEE